MTAKHELRLLFDFFPEDEAFDMLRLKASPDGENRSDTRSGNSA